MRRPCNTPGKRRYRTVNQALRAADRLRLPTRARPYDNPLEVYLCRSGKHFHLCSAKAVRHDVS